MKEKLQAYASDPMLFFSEIQFPSCNGAERFGDVMADHQRAWFEAIAPSLVAVARGEQPDCTRFWSERTKGGSKDSDCACVLLWLLAFSPRKLDCQVGAADRDQAAELKKAAADILRINPWLSQRIEVQAWTLICKATGSECAIVASDVAGSHGARPDITVVNELSHIQKEEFASNLADNATKKPRGLFIVCTNAGFKGTWQERWRQTALDSDSNRWNFHRLAEPSPWLTDAAVDEAKRRNSTARFNRLFYGDWVSQSGDALDEADIKAAVKGQPVPCKQPGWFYIAGLDLGIKHDHSALVVVAGNRSTLELKVAYAKSWSPDASTGQVNLMQVEREVETVSKLYGTTTIGFDPFQAALLSQRLTARKVKMQEMTFTGKNLDLMASTLLDVFRSRRITLYDHPQLIADLGRLTIVEKSYGYKLEAVSDESGHADVATALAIALPIVVEASGKIPYIVGADSKGNLTPYQREMIAFERRRAQYEKFMDEAPSHANDPTSEYVIFSHRQK